LQHNGIKLKQVFVYLMTVCGIVACNTDAPWTEQDRKDFIGGCLKGTARDMTQEQASVYCNCMWQQIQQRYPTAVSPNFIKNDTALARLGKDCIAKSKTKP
jgi:hypothetical protein